MVSLVERLRAEANRDESAATFSAKEGMTYLLEAHKRNAALHTEAADALEELIGAGAPFERLMFGDGIFDDDVVVLDTTQSGSFSLIRRVTRGDFRRLAAAVEKAMDVAAR